MKLGRVKGALMYQRQSHCGPQAPNDRVAPDVSLRRDSRR